MKKEAVLLLCAWMLWGQYPQVSPHIAPKNPFLYIVQDAFETRKACLDVSEIVGKKLKSEREQAAQEEKVRLDLPFKYLCLPDTLNPNG